MDRAAAVRTFLLYLELALATVLWLKSPRSPRAFAACLVSTLWVAPSLLIVQCVNRWANWWTFEPGIAGLRGMPLDIYFAWIVLWGILPALVFPRFQVGWAMTSLVIFDLIAMPACASVVTLNSNWLWGEAVAALLVLLPALCLTRWTFDQTHLNSRAALQLGISAMLFLFLIPELTFALKKGAGWTPLLTMPSWKIQLALQGMVILALPGLNAVMEFAGRGGGTPIPYDPPKRLVTSGVYRYCANPMQLACAIAMFAWAVLLHSPWMAVAAAVSLVYSAGIANWDEGADLSKRFGKRWTAYRADVRPWRIRWRPYVSHPVSTVYIAATCGACSELRAWIERRNPLGLTILDAECLPTGSITRMRYDPGDGASPEHGVRAFGRVLEHLNFGWALAGFALRIPVVWHGAQLLLDASGLGPRTLRHRAP